MTTVRSISTSNQSDEITAAIRCEVGFEYKLGGESCPDTPTHAIEGNRSTGREIDDEWDDDHREHGLRA